MGVVGEEDAHDVMKVIRPDAVEFPATGCGVLDHWGKVPMILGIDEHRPSRRVPHMIDDLANDGSLIFLD